MPDINNTSLSTYPEEIDEFDVLSDLDAATLAKANTYKGYINAGQYSQAETYLNNNPDLKACGVSASDFNKHSDAIVAIEEYVDQIQGDVYNNTSDITSIQRSINTINSNINNLQIEAEILTALYDSQNNYYYFKNSPPIVIDRIYMAQFTGNTIYNPTLYLGGTVSNLITIPAGYVYNNDIILFYFSRVQTSGYVWEMNIIQHISKIDRDLNMLIPNYSQSDTNGKYIGFYHYPVYEKVYEMTLTGSDGIHYEGGWGATIAGVQNDILSIEGRIIDSDGSAYLINAPDEHIKVSQQLINGTSIDLVFNWNNLSNSGDKKLLAVVRYTSVAI